MSELMEKLISDRAEAVYKMVTEAKKIETIKLTGVERLYSSLCES